MTVPEIDTLCWSSAAYSRRVARLSPGEAVTQAGRDLARMQEWPLRSYLELRALPACVRSARLHAKNTLREWHIRLLTDTVELLVSEIITNAVRASANTGNRRPGTGPSQTRPSQRAPWIRFWLTSDRRSVLIQVWDGDRHHPVPQNAGPDAEAGRGLLLVETLSTEWGCYVPDAQDGKIVWAVCAQ
jgi:Histidine kinase-like ATPase domain